MEDGPEVPEGWRRVRLGELLSSPVRNGYSPVCPSAPTGKWITTLSAVGPSGFDPTAVKPAPPDDPRVDTALLRHGDFLVSRSNTRDRVGFAAVFRGERDNCSHSDLLMRFRVRPDLTDDHFLEHFLRSFSARSYFEGCAAGTSGSMVKITGRHLEDLGVSLPPLPEQRRIAEVLGGVDEAIRATQAVIEATRKVKQGLLQELLTRGIGHTRFQQTEIGEIPAGWEVVAVHDVVSKVTRPVEVVSDAIYREIGIRSHGLGIFHKEPVLGAKLGGKRVFRIEPNCFVANIVFAWERAVACTSEREVGMVASHRFPMFRPDPLRLNLHFLTLFFQSSRGASLLGLASPGGAGRNRTLGQQAFLGLPVPIPSLGEQNTIVDTWRRVVASQTSEEKHLATLVATKRGLMQDLLTGRVRVPLP